MQPLPHGAVIDLVVIGRQSFAGFHSASLVANAATASTGNGAPTYSVRRSIPRASSASGIATERVIDVEGDEGADLERFPDRIAAGEGDSLGEVALGQQVDAVGVLTADADRAAARRPDDDGRYRRAVGDRHRCGRPHVLADERLTGPDRPQRGDRLGEHVPTRRRWRDRRGRSPPPRQTTRCSPRCRHRRPAEHAPAPATAVS